MSEPCGLSTGKTAISNMVSFMQALFCFIYHVMAGAVASIAQHPFLLATITILGTLTKDIVFPLLYLSTVLNLVYVVPEINVGRLASFISGVCVLLGMVLCVFVGVSAVQGAAGKVVDSVDSGAKFWPVLYSCSWEAVCRCCGSCGWLFGCGANGGVLRNGNVTAPLRFFHS